MEYLFIDLKTFKTFHSHSMKNWMMYFSLCNKCHAYFFNSSIASIFIIHPNVWPFPSLGKASRYCSNVEFSVNTRIHPLKRLALGDTTTSLGRGKWNPSIQLIRQLCMRYWLVLSAIYWHIEMWSVLQSRPFEKSDVFFFVSVDSWLDLFALLMPIS